MRWWTGREGRAGTPVTPLRGSPGDSTTTTAGRRRDVAALRAGRSPHDGTGRPAPPHAPAGAAA
ncbi:hypothetical protein MO973_05980 [Paenibacillus sp. TRM 82003]|nr:hypothetical protein [Paenibacillus sp. TRM 82003]